MRDFRDAINQFLETLDPEDRDKITDEELVNRLKIGTSAVVSTGVPAAELAEAATHRVNMNDLPEAIKEKLEEAIENSDYKNVGSEIQMKSSMQMDVPVSHSLACAEMARKYPEGWGKTVRTEMNRLKDFASAITDQIDLDIETFSDMKEEDIMKVHCFMWNIALKNLNSGNITPGTVRRIDEESFNESIENVIQQVVMLSKQNVQQDNPTTSH